MNTELISKLLYDAQDLDIEELEILMERLEDLKEYMIEEEVC